MEIINTLPYLVVEELKPRSPVSGVFGIGDNVPIARSREKHIKRVHAIRFSNRGCYLGKKLDKNPHYTVNTEEFDLVIRRRCEDLRIPLKVYSAHKVMQVSDILTVFNFPKNETIQQNGEKSIEGCVATAKLLSLLDELRFSDF